MSNLKIKNLKVKSAAEPDDVPSIVIEQLDEGTLPEDCREGCEYYTYIQEGRLEGTMELQTIEFNQCGICKQMDSVIRESMALDRGDHACSS